MNKASEHLNEQKHQELLNKAMDLIDELELIIHYMFMAVKDL